MTKRKTHDGHDRESLRLGMVHFILSHSYSVFLIAVIAGAICHSIFTISLFENPIYPYVGLIMIILGSALIYWAQTTSNRTSKEVMNGIRTERDFERGPYKYTRSPTHSGLAIMILGLSIILNSFFTFIFVVIATILTKRIFLKKEEALLEKRYGDIYREYKEKVRI